MDEKEVDKMTEKTTEKVQLFLDALRHNVGQLLHDPDDNHSVATKCLMLDIHDDPFPIYNDDTIISTYLQYLPDVIESIDEAIDDPVECVISMCEKVLSNLHDLDLHNLLSLLPGEITSDKEVTLDHIPTPDDMSNAFGKVENKQLVVSNLLVNPEYFEALEEKWRQDGSNKNVTFSHTTTLRSMSVICGRPRNGLESLRRIWTAEVLLCDDLHPGDIYLFAPNEFVGPLVGRRGLSWFECGKLKDKIVCKSAVVRGYEILNRDAVVRIRDTSFGS